MFFNQVQLKYTLVSVLPSAELARITLLNVMNGWHVTRKLFQPTLAFTAHGTRVRVPTLMNCFLVHFQVALVFERLPALGTLVDFGQRRDRRRQTVRPGNSTRRLILNSQQKIMVEESRRAKRHFAVIHSTTQNIAQLTTLRELLFLAGNTMSQNHVVLKCHLVRVLLAADLTSKVLLRLVLARKVSAQVPLIPETLAAGLAVKRVRPAPVHAVFVLLQWGKPVELLIARFATEAARRRAPDAAFCRCQRRFVTTCDAAVPSLQHNRLPMSVCFHHLPPRSRQHRWSTAPSRIRSKQSLSVSRNTSFWPKRSKPPSSQTTICRSNGGDRNGFTSYKN